MQSFLLSSEENTQQQPLISVCCICNRQRTSIDTWEPLNLTNGSEEPQNLTHGFCPDCIREHYPQASYKLDEMLAQNSN